MELLAYLSLLSAPSWDRDSAPRPVARAMRETRLAAGSIAAAFVEEGDNWRRLHSGLRYQSPRLPHQRV